MTLLRVAIILVLVLRRWVFVDLRGNAWIEGLFGSRFWGTQEDIETRRYKIGSRLRLLGQCGGWLNIDMRDYYQGKVNKLICSSLRRAEGE